MTFKFPDKIPANAILIAVSDEAISLQQLQQWGNDMGPLVEAFNTRSISAERVRERGLRKLFLILKTAKYKLTDGDW